jgi:hypothetical protein
MSAQYQTSAELMAVVKLKLKDPEYMRKIKAHILSDVAAFLHETKPEVLAELVVRKMTDGAKEHGQPPTTAQMHKIHMERLDEHTDLIGWYFIYLNARHDL